MNSEPHSPASQTEVMLAEMGRLVTHKLIHAGWHCRWCDRALETVATAIVCTHCDRPQPLVGV